MKQIVVRVDPERCCASGGCVALAPNLFELGQLPHATARKAAYEPGDLELLREAEENCPYGAIEVEPTS
jgi:ferredoxin